MSDVILQVRTGMTHGFQDRYQAGDTLAVSAAEADLLLAAFGDKLERVSEPDSPALDVSGQTLVGPVAKPSRLRHRKPEDL